MAGIIFSILAGFFVTLQSVFNTRVSEKIGLWETVAIVHAVGLLFAIVAVSIYGGGNFLKLGEVNRLYVIGGAFGVIIVYGAMRGISELGAALSVAILLITQLIVATVIDVFGLFGNQQIKLNFEKPLGILVMIIGVIIFKCRG